IADFMVGPGTTESFASGLGGWKEGGSGVFYCPLDPNDDMWVDVEELGLAEDKSIPYSHPRYTTAGIYNGQDDGYFYSLGIRINITLENLTASTKEVELILTVTPEGLGDSFPASLIIDVPASTTHQDYYAIIWREVFY